MDGGPCFGALGRGAAVQAEGGGPSQPCGKAVLRRGGEMDRVGMPQAAAGIAKTEQEKLSQGNKNGQEATGDTLVLGFIVHKAARS